VAEAAAAVFLIDGADARQSKPTSLPAGAALHQGDFEGRHTRFDVAGGVHCAAVGPCTINGRDSMRCSYAIALPSHRSLGVLPWLSALLSRHADHI
jgi:hypothetical protein